MFGFAVGLVLLLTLDLFDFTNVSLMLGQVRLALSRLFRIRLAYK